jgi:hypothetical protein
MFTECSLNDPYSAAMSSVVLREGRHFWEMEVPFGSVCNRLYVGVVTATQFMPAGPGPGLRGGWMWRSGGCLFSGEWVQRGSRRGARRGYSFSFFLAAFNT